MDRPKSLVVAFTRFYGVLILFYGLSYTTYLKPYYERYVTVYANPATHVLATQMFWIGVLHSALLVLAGLALVARAESVIDSLRPPEPEPGFRSLIVAVVKLHGFLLLVYGAYYAIDAVRFFSNFPHFGWHALRSGGPQMSRTFLYLLAGFLVVARAEKIIACLEPRPIHAP